MTRPCHMCGSVGCPYCRGALPVAHVGHRLPFQDVRCPEQRRPIPSDAVACAPTKRDGADEIAGSLGVEVISSIHHVPEATGAVMSDVAKSLPAQSELISRRSEHEHGHGRQVLEEVRTTVRDTVGPRSPGETIERALERAAHRLGISYARAWSYWYGRVRQVPAEELLNIRARAEARRKERIDELREEIRRLEQVEDPVAQPRSRVSEGR